MREPFLAHQMVSLKHGIQIVFMDSESHAHEHVLWTFDDLVIHTEKVRFLKGFKPEEIIREIACVVNFSFNFFFVVHDNVKDFLLDQSSIVAFFSIAVKGIDRLGERSIGGFVQAGNRDSGS